MGFADRSNDQRSFLIKTFFQAHMLHPVSPIGAKKIKPEAVGFGFDLIDQFLFENGPLGRVDDALENRILDPLAVIFADLGYPAQTPRPFVFDRRHIVTHQNHHGIYLQTNGG
ncbi:hypothetical protein DESC_340001 [Desulfosarcina cetonica]|nr:hypothetical protein DESC_340001 [Desulfosarcina cetonica]